MKTILVIEDEKDLAELVAFNLEKEGYRVVLAADGLSGLDKARDNSPDLVLLDLMLPGMTGTDVCKALKSTDKTAGIPVIMLTARGEEIDRVVGFEVGADDYVVKPFSTRELLLRVKAVLRRSAPPVQGGKIITIGMIAIDTDRHTVTVSGTGTELSTIEFKLLLVLAERAGRVQSRERLLKDVWGYSYMGDSRTVDTHLTRLRAKLGAAGELIKTVRGFGYKMEGP
ncbi:MAG TPA: response regulator transcription factor [Geobacteraceae bacterium]|nr:response regulator transcription factor [Geobacteraceae bacterium]